MNIVRGVLGMSIAVVLSMATHRLVAMVESHFDRVDDIESSSVILSETNVVLTSNNDILKSAIIESEESKDDLFDEIKRLQGENEAYDAANWQQQREFQEQDARSQETIRALNKVLREAGIDHIPVPDGVIRMHREKAKTVNARADRYREKGNTTATKQANCLSSVYGF